MGVHATRLSGDEWQEWANQILSHHYGPTEFVKIADNQKGDAGIEGYSRCGHAYQCYGCEEPISTEARYAKQRNKITQDIGKFIANKDKLQPLFGTTVIIRWVLFVPYCDSKDIVAHANKKREEVIAAGLAYVTSDFQVHVCDEAQFAGARDFLLNAKSDAIKLSASPTTVEEIDAWSSADGNDELLSSLDKKIGRLKTLTTDDRRNRFRDSTLRSYLEGQNLLTYLRNYPNAYEKVIATKAHREKGLSLACLTHEGSAASLLKDTFKELYESYQIEAKELAKSTAEMLVREAIGDWLLRCPLDFSD